MNVLRLGSCALAVLSIAIVPRLVSAHARLVSPVPRDNSDSHKDPTGPCGNVPRTGSVTTYAVGESVKITWDETVNHPGCFLVSLSTADDKDFQILSNVKHTAVGATPRPYETTVLLPDGVSCKDCTIQLRQIMLGSETDTCPPVNGSGSNYFSCADVRIGEFDGGAETDSGVSTKPVPVSDGGGTTAPRDAGKAQGDAGTSGNPAQESSGCSVGARAHTRNVPIAGILVALPLLGLLRKHRRTGARMGDTR